MWLITGEERIAYVVVGGKFECKQLCGICRHVWEDNITMDLEEDRRHQLDLSGSVGTSGGII